MERLATPRLADALPTSTPSETVKEVNEEVKQKKLKDGKRGQYQKLSGEDKAAIAKYALENVIANTLRHFKEKNLKATSVSDWRNTYEVVLKEKKKLGEAEVKSLPGKTRGRPPLLGRKCDDILQQLIVSMRSRGSPVGSSVTIGVGRGIMMRHIYNKSLLQEFGGPIILGKA